MKKLDRKLETQIMPQKEACHHNTRFYHVFRSNKLKKLMTSFMDGPFTYLTFPSEKLSLRSQQLGWPVSIFIEQTFHTVRG